MDKKEYVCHAVQQRFALGLVLLTTAKDLDEGRQCLMFNKHMTLRWKELPVLWRTGLLLKIILKIGEMCWGEKKSLLFSRVRHTTWAGVINSAHTKGEQLLTLQFCRNSLCIAVDQDLKISQQWHEQGKQ